MDFLSYVSEVSRGWDEPNLREKGKFPSQQTQNPKGGMYVLSEDMDMKAKVATIARRLEELELKKMHEVQAIFETQAHVMPCTIWQSCDHVVDECPTMTYQPFANHVTMLRFQGKQKSLFYIFFFLFFFFFFFVLFFSKTHWSL